MNSGEFTLLPSFTKNVATNGLSLNATHVHVSLTQKCTISLLLSTEHH